jgi:hypothetical protein
MFTMLTDIPDDNTVITPLETGNTASGRLIYIADQSLILFTFYNDVHVHSAYSIKYPKRE